RVATFAPKMLLENANITFIRPLLLAHENEIKRLVKEENLPVLESHCPADKTTTREDIKNILMEIYSKYPQAKDNFLTMLSNYEQIDLWGSDLRYQINQSGLTLKPVTTPLEMFIMCDLRHKVFVEEQGFSYEIEMVEEEEKSAKNFLIYLKDKPIGCMRYRPYEKGYKIERVAMLKEYRGHGYGASSVKFLMDMIGEKYNPCDVYVHSQMQVNNFYVKLGFEPYDDIIYEGGVPHQKMKKHY
ncbi:MAG: GNAT family N-acetyltransferase, partial [Bacilli bacterium]|nr:GNAT family N-acetyltransferase [Bacilli bacterium]